MKAVLVRAFGSIDAAKLEEFLDPVAKPGDVVIDVEAVETNYPDVLVIEGRYQFKPQLPFIPGKAAAGRIGALGEGVKGLAVGQRVAVQMENGAYASKVCVPERFCYPIPDGISAVHAAALVLAYQTAWWAFTDRAQLVPGESVLVLGAGGGVGVAAIGLAKALGAGVVIGATRGLGKAAAIRKAGADHIVDLAQANLREGLRNDIRRATGGKGVDVVIDAVGGAATDAALRAMAWRGRLVVVGFAGGDIPTIRANYLLVKNIAVSGLQVSDYRDRWPQKVAHAQAEIFRLCAEGRLTPVVSEVLPLASFAEALTALREGRAEGKIILEVG